MTSSDIDFTMKNDKCHLKNGQMTPQFPKMTFMKLVIGIKIGVMNYKVKNGGHLATI